MEYIIFVTVFYSLPFLGYESVIHDLHLYMQTNSKMWDADQLKPLSATMVLY